MQDFITDLIFGHIVAPNVLAAYYVFLLAVVVTFTPRFDQKNILFSHFDECGRGGSSVEGRRKRLCCTKATVRAMLPPCCQNCQFLRL